jgi:hypothetical protein
VKINSVFGIALAFFVTAAAWRVRRSFDGMKPALFFCAAAITMSPFLVSAACSRTSTHCHTSGTTTLLGGNVYGIDGQGGRAAALWDLKESSWWMRNRRQSTIALLRR